ncbi:3-isopropylmalate dehydrogenase [Kordiimonas sp. SCSIO 12610]|uniref:3-isopropylmalate dehydrogenase n=1 Tax=Kordiimonas sp. SCSIO 12610 TaxID=2829597 RepID=UPI00210DBAFB|nr:3-isopropylmalate dehydrogenase [Kordiimonas sp. SCSIO 12610]UTW55048.1 3-isopropylmalate dehydrogenase [Kordiimonas sp. SCSIO 12610]
MTTHKLMLLPGDGIGPEIMAEVTKVIAWTERAFDVTFDVSSGLVGGCAYDAEGVPLSDETLAAAKACDAIIMGAVGGPKWDGVDYDKRPEAGLLRLRKELDAFANLRPAICFDALADASSLKREFVAGLDLLFVRELSSGVYFGEPRGIETLDDGSRVGINTQRYTEAEIERIAHVGFQMAQKRGGRVASAEKSNVMEAGLLWREVVTEVHQDHYSDVELTHILADNCAMQLVKNPKQFDVILTDNLFGDLLSDEAAMLTGSLGMLPSASLGNGEMPGLYEPVHGSAPDIAGEGIANPIAAILSFAMALRYSLNMGGAATAVEAAVDRVLADNVRTSDIWAEGTMRVTTSQMGDAILKKLDDN